MTRARIALLLLCARSSWSATGNVQYTGTVIDSGNITGTYTSAKAYDGDVTTSYSAATGQWTGMDIGTAVTMVRVLVMARMTQNDCGDYNPCWYRNNDASVIEASNASDFSGSVTVRALTQYPYVSEFVYNQFPLSPGTAYRYYRVRSPSGYGDIAELRWIGQAAAGANAKPVSPVISPWGGDYVSGSVLVTLTSETTSSTIRYTTDGSTPTCSSTTYTAPFTLTLSSSTTLKAVACDASLSTQASESSTATFRNYGYKINDAWYETTTGVPVQAFAGEISGYFGGRYYKVGPWMYGGPCGPTSVPQSPCTDHMVWLYSSSDLYNWRVESMILDHGASAGIPQYAIQRPHILYNSSTSTYVLWSHCIDGAGDHACIATAAAITGPWTWRTPVTNTPNGYRDCTLFQDTDGTAYTVATDSSQTDMWIYKLSSDYLSLAGPSLKVLTGGGNESPILFKKGAVYYLIYAPPTAYGATSHPSYITSSSVLSGWSAPTYLFGSYDPPFGFAGQPTFVYNVPGKVNAYMYGADNWQVPVYNSTHEVIPLTVSGTTLTPQVLSTWDLSYWPDSSVPVTGHGHVGKFVSIVLK